jgi:predicted nucleic acid-binding protein
MSVHRSLGERVFVDTNAYGALAVARDQSHQRALDVLRMLSQNHHRLYTTNFVLAETHALILARRGREAALRTLRRIEGGSTTVIRVDEGDERRARQIIEDHRDKDYTLTDAMSFVVMERLAIVQAFTFDRHFRQYGFVVLGLDP